MQTMRWCTPTHIEKKKKPNKDNKEYKNRLQTKVQQVKRRRKKIGNGTVTAAASGDRGETGARLFFFKRGVGGGGVHSSRGTSRRSTRVYHVNWNP